MSTINFHLKSLLLTTLILITISVNAGITLNPLFNSNMVLQRGMPIPVFGNGSNGDKVTVSLNNEVLSTAVLNGTWKVIFPIKNPGGSYTLKIIGTNYNKTLTNILIGDVWLCTGQSNMQSILSSYLSRGINNKGYSEFSLIPGTYSNDAIRIMRVATKESHQLEISPKIMNNWAPLTPETALNFSATGYFFGKKLQPSLGIPIGLIQSAVGSTRISQWMSEESLSPLDVPTNKSNSSKSLFYNAMINPLHQIPITGIIWYQGEGDCHKGFLNEYYTVFPELIKSWRHKWGQGNFPFLFVQLAAYDKLKGGTPDDEWSWVRDAQLETWKNIRNTGMTVAMDAGLENNIHPPYKKLVGERLANIARNMVYHQNTTCFGPRYKSVYYKNNKAIVEFDHIESGLQAKELTLNSYVNPYTMNQGHLYGFTIAGSDEKFHQAYAKITTDNKVEVWAPEVPTPVAVRYGWARFALCNLYNNQDLPASPFRTDDFSYTGKSGITIYNPKVEKFRVYTRTTILNTNSIASKTKVYPNPASDRGVTIKFEQNFEINEVSIINIVGKLVYKKQVNTRQLHIPTSEIKNGIYIIIIKNDRKIESHRLVIN